MIIETVSEMKMAREAISRFENVLIENNTWQQLAIMGEKALATRKLHQDEKIGVKEAYERVNNYLK